ncbi:membrane protein [Streptomyces atrovirens]|uniref:Integral membrane protein n=1 Tax=Streptomyces atrovirens TaxID=285556 RepID=A0ABW0DW99_9ACTN
MGIESDQVVYEYLSRVGDVAQQRQLPSAARMRLVAELRDEIDRRRAKAVVDSPAAVRRIISRIGTPTEVVTAAEDTSAAASAAPSAAAAAPPAAVPVQREREGGAGARGDAREDARDSAREDAHDGARADRPKGVLRRIVPRPRPAGAPDGGPVPADVPSPPHRAGTDELGDSATQPDWWRVDNSAFGIGDEVPGFVGGVEIPELLKPPPAKEKEETPAEPAAAPEAEEEPAASRRRLRRLLPRLPSGRWSNPLLLLAAGLLVAGTVIGDWRALILGWLIAYASRRLTQAEIKWAVVILPGLALAGGVVWLWGRTAGRWGTPIAEGHMNAAISETWPWVVRAAALTTALFLVWRSQRQKG